jgi:hypothetical protein
LSILRSEFFTKSRQLPAHVPGRQKATSQINSPNAAA